MAIEFKVTLEDKPGSLARFGTVLGDARVNIDAIQGTSDGSTSSVRFVTGDTAQASKALRGAGLSFVTREVLVVRVLDEPGVLGEVALVMSEAGINIDSVYVTTTGDVVLGVDDVDGAIQVAGGMAVIANV